MSPERGARSCGLGGYARAFLALAAVVGSPLAGHAQEVPIVYVRCPRTTASLDLSMEVEVGGVRRTATRTMTGLDVYDVLPDVTNFFSGFNAPCDLVHRDAGGDERVLYDCSSSSTDDAACAAMDPAVSFDGATVAFSVFRGTLEQASQAIHPRVVDPAAENTANVRFTLPNRRLAATEAQLHLVDVESGEVRALPHVEGAFDAGPAFLPNGRLAFTSTRDASRSTLVWNSNTTDAGSRIYAMDLDGRNVDLSSHHSLAQDQHPFVLRDGRLAYTSWQIFGGLPFRHTNGAPGGFTTLRNLFHIYTQHPDGAEPFAFYGQHSGDHVRTTSIGIDHKAAHFLTQTSDERVWFADYYRGNNAGLGVVIGVMPEPEGMEGFGPHEITARGDLYAPRDAIRLTRWAHSTDGMASPVDPPELRHPSYADPLPFAGKVGHPAALPEGGLMVVWGKGACSTLGSGAVFAALGREAPPLTSGSGSGTAMNVITSLGLDTPGCDAGIYRATAIPSTHPSDLAIVVDHRDWHELQARALVPYAAIHGVDRPRTIEPADLRASHSALEVGTPFGLLGAASILDRETHPFGGISFQGEHQFHNQGTDTIDYTDDDLCGVRILGVMPNRGRDTHRELANVAGERVRILGEIPVRSRDASGAARMDPSGHPDTSFLVRFPANVPYLMQGIDCDGRTLNTDQTWQSLRPGEMKTCGGCHVHSRPTRVSFGESFAATDEYEIPRLGEGVVPLLAGSRVDGSVEVRTEDGYGLAIDFEEDVMPIFARRCTHCHGGADPVAGLALDRPGIDADASGTWHCLIADRSQRCVPETLRHDTGAGSANLTFRRPQLTRYVRAFNSRASLLYWKAAGQRTDGRTDDTFGDDDTAERRDIDFGAAHPTEITPDELGLLSRWIDIGSPGGPMEALDTQRPTLHLAASVDGERVTALHIGTVDLGSGVDPSSLEVCVLDPAGACVASLAGDAAPHGVVELALDAPISDPEVEVLARVSDLAGNETEVRRTVAWLLRAPPPPPPPPTPRPHDGGSEPAEDGGTGGDMPAGCGCRAASSGAPAPLWLAALALLFARRRRRAALLLPVVLAACSTDPLALDASVARDAASDATGATAIDAMALDAQTEPDAGSGCGSSDATSVEAAALSVVHHDGQSLVSWPDRAEGAEGAAYRYRLYRSRAPIVSDADLDGAELVARGILNHSGQLFGGAFRPAQREDPELPMSIVEEGGEPLPTWSGLAVATARANDCAYYAVLATDADDMPVEAIEPGRNATTEPVAERVAPIAPMRVWTSDERPGPSVSQTRITGAEGLPLMLVLHGSDATGGGAGEYGDYYSYFGDRTMGYRDGMPGVFSVDERRSPQMLHLRSRDAIVRPDGGGAVETYWFGYTAHPEDGERFVYPYTEARLRFLLPFAIERYAADPERVYARGRSMGSTGSVQFAFRRPEIFAAVYPNMPRFRRASLVAVGTTPTTAGDTLPDGSPWEAHLDSVRFARSHPGSLPFLGWNIGRRDHTSAWQNQIDMVRAMTEMRHGFAFSWNDGNHSGGVAAADEIERWYPPLRFARNLSYPAFTESSIDDDLGDGDPADGDLVGGINLGFVWTDPVEDERSWSVTISNELCEAPMTVSVTPRRAQRFLPAAGASIRYVTSTGAEGNVEADAHGLVTVRGIVIEPGATTTVQLTAE